MRVEKFTDLEVLMANQENLKFSFLGKDKKEIFVWFLKDIVYYVIFKDEDHNTLLGFKSRNKEIMKETLNEKMREFWFKEKSSRDIISFDFLEQDFDTLWTDLDKLSLEDFDISPYSYEKVQKVEKVEPILKRNYNWFNWKRIYLSKSWWGRFTSEPIEDTISSENLYVELVSDPYTNYDIFVITDLKTKKKYLWQSLKMSYLINQNYNDDIIKYHSKTIVVSAYTSQHQEFTNLYYYKNVPVIEKDNKLYFLSNKEYMYWTQFGLGTSPTPILKDQLKYDNWLFVSLQDNWSKGLFYISFNEKDQCNKVIYLYKSVKVGFDEWSIDLDVKDYQILSKTKIIVNFNRNGRTTETVNLEK